MLQGWKRHGHSCYTVTSHEHNFYDATQGYYCKAHLLQLENRCFIEQMICCVDLLWKAIPLNICGNIAASLLASPLLMLAGLSRPSSTVCWVRVEPTVACITGLISWMRARWECTAGLIKMASLSLSPSVTGTNISQVARCCICFVFLITNNILWLCSSGYLVLHESFFPSISFIYSFAIPLISHCR